MAQQPRQLVPERSPVHRFGAELRRWRECRGYSQDDLGRLVHVSGDQIAKVEKAVRRPTEDLARRCDEVLATGGALESLWPAAQSGRRQPMPPDLIDRDLAGHWDQLLGVLALTANTVGVAGLSGVVRDETAVIHGHFRVARGSARVTLGSTLVRWLEFGSWIADNDGEGRLAATRLAQAESLASQSSDHALAGYLAMRRAQRVVEAESTARVAEVTRVAADDRRLPSRVRALSAVRRGQAWAAAGDASAAASALDAAQTLVQRADEQGEDAPAIAVHCTPGYVQAHEARCRMLLGEYEGAISSYRTVLGTWSSTQRLDEGLFRAHLAEAYEAVGAFADADHQATAALTIGRQTASRRTLSVVARWARTRSGGPGRGASSVDAWTTCRG